MPRPPKATHDHPELGLPEVRKLWQTGDLFSDHYLKARVRHNAWWPGDAEAKPIWEFCKALYDKRYLACAKNNEMFTRQELLNKILEKLGFGWTDNLAQPETKQQLEPDYIVFANDAEKEAVINQDAAHRYRAAIAILEAKKLHHPLSQISKTQQRYPHQQIRDYLNEAQVLTWGILTNGNEWRLYCRDTKPSHFFAINFELAIQSLDAFKLFLALFSPAAFVRDAQGKCRLDHVRESALAAQSELEEDLRQRIFAIVEILANGFAGRAENEITDADLPALYDTCLIFLYRLLFILYAEGRQLLPVEPKSCKYYKELSLARLVAPLKNFSEHDSHTRTRLCEDIRELCHLINGTDEKKNAEFKVPRYNGGLFAPERHPLLEKWRVCDAVLADVLRGLMFSPPPERDKPSLPIITVDFGDLRVQQLGSIYEGLLEHHFAREGGRLVLKTDKAERKATGTYYTPDYIVKYIVEQTVVPLLAEIEQREPVKNARSEGLKDNSFAREALKLNILDPAMGSGHFLVEATTFLADEIATHPTTQPLGEKSKDEDEIAHWRRRVVESCIYGVDLNPLAVELAKLSLWLTCIASDQPLNFLDHHLCCGNSLIGARLDQLGSLPQTKGKGDARQIHFTFGPDFKRTVAEATRQIHKIESESSRDVAAVKSKEQRWELEVLPRLAPYKKVADLWTNTFFDGPMSEEEYLAAAREILVEAERSANLLREDDAPCHIKEFDKPYFHWELQFPEVFFTDDGTPRESPGFDAVIGNPPYVDIKGLEAEMVDYLFKTFPSTRLRVNIFAAFIEQGVAVARSPQGGVGVIVPTAFLTQLSYANLRDLVFRTCWLKNVVRLPNELFGAAAGEVKVDTCIIVIQKTAEPLSATECLVYDSFQRVPKISRETASAAFDIPQQKWAIRENKEITLTSINEDSILDRMRSNATRLDELCDFCLGLTPYDKYSGHTQEQIENKVFHAKDRIDSTCKKLLLSGDVRRYAVEWNGQDWIKYGDWLAAPRAERFFTAERILVQQIIDWSSLRILAGWTDEELYNTQNQFNLLARSATNLKFVIAVLNSKIISYYHRRAFLDVALQRFQKILIKDAKTFPFPRIDFTTPAAKRAAQLGKAKSLYEKSLADGDATNALRCVEAELQAGRADVVHDLLAFLAERMMAMNAEKRTTAKQFLTDLKDFHGIEARALNPKTKLDEFWKLAAADVFAHLRKNTKLLATQNVRLTEDAEEKIRARFSKSQSVLLPLETQISFTDTLIDEIVYRLYALTADEIKIVKAASK